MFPQKLIVVLYCIHTYMLFSSLPIRGFSVADYINYLSYLLSLTIYVHILFCLHYFPNYLSQTTLSTFPVEGNRRTQEKPMIFSRPLPMCDQMFDTRIEHLTSVVGGSGLDH